MKRLMPIIIIATFALIMVFSSCEKVVYPPVEIILPDTVSLSLDIQPIFDSKCVTCHDGSPSPDLREGYSHDALWSGGLVDTANAENSKIIKKLHSSSHSGRANEEQIQLIQEWIAEGAKDN